MSSPFDPDGIEALKELLAAKEAIVPLREAARTAKTAYRANPDDPELRAAHRAASQALADARDDARGAGVAAVPSTPGSATVLPVAVGRQGRP